MNTDQNPTEAPRARRRGPISLFADFALALQERILWPLADTLRVIPGSIGRFFAAIGRGFKRALVWPLTDRFALLGGFGRVALVAGLALLVAVGVAAALTTRGGSSGTEVQEVAAAATPAPAAPAPKPAPAPKRESTLHGPAPAFSPPQAKEPAGAAKPKAAKAEDASSAAPSEDATETSDTETTGTGSAPAANEKIGIYPTASRPTAAEATEIPGPTAGAAALAVAREFSGAFVVYETKGKSDGVRKAFASTATPELTKALLKRPPTQPKVKVPKARVLNIVPGPSRGGVFTVSVSLLRVGVTSELRLEMEKLKKQGWRVTNVLG